MKKAFKEYYGHEENFQSLWEEGIFVFDTNILLNLYRYSDGTRNKWFEVFNKIKDRIFMPYNVGLEYHKNRITRINFEKKQGSETVNSIDEAFKNNCAYLERCKGYQQEIDKLKTKYEEIKKAINEIRNSHPDFIKNDLVREFLNTIYDGKVGDPFSNEELNKLYKLAEERFEKKIPPGYSDAKNKTIEENLYGDFIIWKQLLQYSQKTNKPVIFVTDDSKPDWWESSADLKYQPRFELVKEFRDETCMQYWQYNSKSFFHFVDKYLAVKITDEVLKETDEVSNDDSYDIELQKQAKLEAISELKEKYGDGLSNWSDSSVYEALKKEALNNLYDQSSYETLKKLNSTMNDKSIYDTMRKIDANLSNSSSLEAMRKLNSSNSILEEMRKLNSSNSFLEEMRKLNSSNSILEKMKKLNTNNLVPDSLKDLSQKIKGLDSSHHKTSFDSTNKEDKNNDTADVGNLNIKKDKP